MAKRKKTVDIYEENPKLFFDFEFINNDGNQFKCRANSKMLPCISFDDQILGYDEPKILKKEALLEKAVSEQKLKHALPYPPAYSFPIGDKVKIGGLINCVIEDVLLNGEYYVVRYIRKETNYGHPYIYETNNIFPWYRIKKEVKGTSNFTVDKNKVYYRNSTIESMLHSYYSFGFNMSPVYQRDYVWSDEDKEKLLTSIFNFVPIGNFTVGKYPEWFFENEIIDGKQRLQTIVDFYEERFQYHGKFYSDLSMMDRYTFMNTSVGYAEVDVNNLKEAIEIFLRLNSTGKAVSEEILKKAQKLIKE